MSTPRLPPGQAPTTQREPSLTSLPAAVASACNASSEHVDGDTAFVHQRVGRVVWLVRKLQRFRCDCPNYEKHTARARPEHRMGNVTDTSTRPRSIGLSDRTRRVPRPISNSALDARFAAETEYGVRENIEIVAISAASEEELKRSHGRYFLTSEQLGRRRAAA